MTMTPIMITLSQVADFGGVLLGARVRFLLNLSLNSYRI